jgi:hypothetical protein
VAEQEKPLHVRVAESLGCKPLFGRPLYSTIPYPEDWRCGCLDTKTNDPTEEHDDTTEGHCDLGIKRYDTDWSATGPIIERFGISLRREASGWDARVDNMLATDHNETPLLAVCHLIIALAEAGRLPR